MSNVSENSQKFKQSSRYLAISNMAQVILVLFVLLDLLNQIPFSFPNLLFDILLPIVLVIDFYLTYRFLTNFDAQLHSSMSTRLFYTYLSSSFLSRLAAVLFNFGIIRDLNILSVFFALSGVLFGFLLLQLVGDFEIVHKSKLHLIAYANLTGFSIIFGEFFRSIYTGIKIFTPIFAAFTYLLISFDYESEIEDTSKIEEDLGLFDEDLNTHDDEKGDDLDKT